MRVAAYPTIQVRSVIGTDALREVVRQFIPPEVIPELGYSSYDGYLASGDSANLLEAYRRQGHVISLGIAAIIRRAIEEDIRLIIEGVHVLPGLVRDRLPLAIRGHVAEVLIDIASIEIHRQRLAHRAEFSPGRNVARHLANFDRIRLVRAYLRDTAVMHHVPIVDNDSPDMEHAAATCAAIFSKIDPS